MSFNVINKKNMVNALIKTNQIYENCKPADNYSPTILNYIDSIFIDYNPFGKKVIHNIIWNILKQKTLLSKEDKDILWTINDIVKERLDVNAENIIYIDTRVYLDDTVALFFQGQTIDDIIK